MVIIGFSEYEYNNYMVANSATKEEFDEKKEESQAIVNFITNKLYQDGDSSSQEEPLEN